MPFRQFGYDAEQCAGKPAPPAREVRSAWLAAGCAESTSVMPCLAVLLWAEGPPGYGVLLPLAYYLPTVPNLRIYGIRWAIVIAMVTTAIYAGYFLLGRWQRQRR